MRRSSAGSCKTVPCWKKRFIAGKRPGWVSWRMDEPSIKVKGPWYSLYGAVDKTGQTIDFLFTEQRDEQAAKRFLTKAMRRHGVPEKSPIDGSAANAAAIKSSNAEHGTAIAIRQVQISQQYCGTGSSRGEAGDTADGGVHIVRRSPRHPGRDRTHAHDQETTEGGGGRRRGPHCGRTVRLPGRVIPPQTGATAPARPPEQNLRHNRET